MRDAAIFLARAVRRAFCSCYSGLTSFRTNSPKWGHENTQPLRLAGTAGSHDSSVGRPAIFRNAVCLRCFLLRPSARALPSPGGPKRKPPALVLGYSPLSAVLLSRPKGALDRPATEFLRNMVRRNTRSGQSDGRHHKARLANH